MPYVRVGVHRFKPGTLDGVIAKASSELTPVHARQDGFHYYEIVRTGADTAISISSWDTREQADEAVRRTDRWRKENGVADDLARLEDHVGELVYTSRES
jgi:heme-degrading monooxygenase HmoA